MAYCHLGDGQSMRCRIVSKRVELGGQSIKDGKVSISNHCPNCINDLSSKLGTRQKN